MEIINQNNLYNPKSKNVGVVLYIYSMEFGDPPLYAELNRVSRDRDYSQINNLGPFVCLRSHIREHHTVCV